MMVIPRTSRLVAVVICVAALQHRHAQVNAGYGDSYGPLTCLCADGVYYTLDSSATVRQYGCSLFDHCKSCTNYEHQPCGECPPNRYGLKCENVCDCGFQPCDDGIYGDGECLCTTEDLQEGGRCQPLVTSRTKTLEDGEPFPPPQVIVDSDKLHLSWQLVWFSSDPIVHFRLEYKFADRATSRYDQWRELKTTSAANETFVTFEYPPQNNGFYKFRITGIHRSGRSRKGVPTNAVKVPGTPNAPVDVEIASIQGDTVAIKWSSPPEDSVSGNQITGYIVQNLTFGHLSRWSTFADAKFEGNAVILGGLEPFKIYKFRVAARNKLGIGSWSLEQTIMLPELEDTVECYTQTDGSDYRGRVSTTISGKQCEAWPGYLMSLFGLGSYCRNPFGYQSSAWCYTIPDNALVPEACNIGEPRPACPKPCPDGMVLSASESCVADDQTQIYNRVPLVNGEICTCAFQKKDDLDPSGKYIQPQSFVGWTYACAHAVGRDAQSLVDNIYNMDADVCYQECLKSGCEAYTYSTHGYNKNDNETDVRLCTLYTDMNTPIVLQKNDEWAKYLDQNIDDGNYILTWGCWAETDPRNPGEIWRDVGLQNFMVFRNLAYKNYSINVYMTEGPTDGLHIAFMIVGTLNDTTPINLFIKPGNRQFYVINRNVGFVTALKLVGQIGNGVTVETVEIQLDSVITTFTCDWCGESYINKMEGVTECQRKGFLGGTVSNTRLITPATTTIFSDYHGFACTTMAYSTAYNEAFFGWCPLTPQLVSIGIPSADNWPPYFVEIGEREDPYRRRKRDADEEEGRFLITTESKSWQGAADACLAQGRILVKVLDDETLIEVEEEIKKHGLTQQDFWINGYRDNFGVWKAQDNLPLSLEGGLWAEGQPDNSGKCLQLWYRGDTIGHKLDDTACNDMKYFICETQSTAKSSDCKSNNDIFANTECVALLNFRINSLRSRNLEDMSVIVESAVMDLNFKGERDIRYLALEGVIDPWTRISSSNTSIPRSVLIDTIDTNTTSHQSVSIRSDSLTTLLEGLLNGKFIAGRNGFMLRPLKDQQQAGFDDIIVWKQSSLRPKLSLQIKLFKWSVGPWSACDSAGCIGEIQTRRVKCVQALTNLPTDEKFCRYKLRPHTNQSCVYHYIASCFQWKYRPRPGAACQGSYKCGAGHILTELVCVNKESQQAVPEYYCSFDKPDRETPYLRCSDYSECTYYWDYNDWSKCSGNCGGGFLSRSVFCVASNGSRVGDSYCQSSPEPASSEACQDYSDCNVWQSLQLLRQGQIYSQRTRIDRQLNLTLPDVQARADLIAAKQDIAEREIEFEYQTLRANMSIPEQLAKAELLEVRARQSSAKNRLEVPADGKTSFPNIGYLGRGYDIFYGNPRNDDGSVDPGFRQAVIGLTYDKVRFSSDRMFLMPDQADVIREMGSSFGSTTSIITSERSYKNSLELDVSVEAKGTIEEITGGFSASTSYHTMTQTTVNMRNVYVDVVGRVIVYDARLAPFNADASDEFREAVKNLPAIACCTYSVRCHSDCGFYDDFIGAFGTHYATRVLMGGKATQRYQMTSQSMEKIQENELSSSFEVSAGVTGIFEVKESIKSKISNSMKNSLSQSDQSSTEFFLGGQAGVGEIKEGSTNSMKEWASTVFDNPVPIKYSLAAVVDLLSPENFPNDKKIETKQGILRAKYQGYCNRIPDARCTDFSQRGQDEDGNAVHVGDIVHITMRDCNGKVFFLRDETEGIYAAAADFKGSSTSKASIIPLPNQLCTWVQQKSSGPSNPNGNEWVKFMTQVHNTISSKCVTYTGLSEEDCEDHCKQTTGCQAGTFTAHEGGFCIIFTSSERVEIPAYHDVTTGVWFWKKTKSKLYDFTYHWSCYHELDKEHFGNIWDDLKLKSFRVQYRVVSSEQNKLFAIVSPLSIVNVQREELHYGDHFMLASATGAVNRDEGEDDYKSASFDVSRADTSGLLRFRVVNDHKPNGMVVKLGDILMIQEANRFQETLLMQNLPRYLSINAKGPEKTCRGIWPFQVCTEGKNIRATSHLLDDCQENAFTWNITLADVRSLIPEFNVPVLAGLSRVDFQVQEDKMSVVANVFFTRPIRRKQQIPDTVADEVSTITLLPGYDGHDVISSDFIVTLRRGNVTILKPTKQRFLFLGRDLTEYRLGIYFQERLQDGDVLILEMSGQIVSEDENTLGGQTSTEYHVYLVPTYTAHVSDATSLLTGGNVEKGNITVRVTFDKAIVNAEREVPDIYDFEIADYDNETMSDVILRVDVVNPGQTCKVLTRCAKEFDVVISSSFLKRQTKFYFDIVSGRLKSARDFLFVGEKQILMNLFPNSE